MITKIRGVRDIIPPEIYWWQKIEAEAKAVFEAFGFSEIRTPIIEPTELFQRSIGQYTDIVSKEMYTFEDRKGRSLTLRPEGTASVIRAYIEERMLPPKRFYYMGPMFRYEKPQAGRQRQFYQMGIELIGEKSPYADAEVIILLNDFFKNLGLDTFEIVLNSVGCPECREEYETALKTYFNDKIQHMCRDCQYRYENNVFRILDCKNDTCQVHIDNAPIIMDFLCDSCQRHYNELKQILLDNEVAFVENPRLVRGLDYYTKTAFEVVVATLGAQNAIAAGGRYDNLIEQLGGASTPAVGMAIGLERLVMVLKANVPDFIKPVEMLGVAFAKEEYKAKAFEYLRRLRRAGYRAISFFDRPSIKSQLKQVNKLGIRWVIIIGDEEIKRGMFSLKDMKQGEQILFSDTELEKEVQRRIGHV